MPTENFATLCRDDAASRASGSFLPIRNNLKMFIESLGFKPKDVRLAVLRTIPVDVAANIESLKPVDKYAQDATSSETFVKQV